MSIGQRLAVYVEQMNLTQDEIAKAVGTTRQTINHALNGKHSPSGEVIAKILIAFPEMDADYLVTGRTGRIKTTNQINTSGNENSFGKVHFGDKHKVSEPGAVYGNPLIEAMQSQIEALKETIKAKDELIDALRGKK